MTEKYYSQLIHFKITIMVFFVSSARSIAPQMAPSEVLECAVEPPDKENVTSAIKNLADIGAISCKLDH